MFFIQHSRAGVTYLVFTCQDPRKDEFRGTVEDGVSLDYNMNVHDWPDGDECPEAVLGRDPSNPKRYKVFKYARDLKVVNFIPITGIVCVFHRWSDYTRPNS
jgi:hypothetical protein